LIDIICVILVYMYVFFIAHKKKVRYLAKICTFFVSKNNNNDDVLFNVILKLRTYITKIMDILLLATMCRLYTLFECAIHHADTHNNILNNKFVFGIRQNVKISRPSISIYIYITLRCNVCVYSACSILIESK